MSTEPKARRSVLREAADWRALRAGRYGLVPVVVLTLVVFVQDFNAALFGARGGIAGPDIARDLDVDLRGIFGIISTIAALTIIGGVGIGWFADRHRRTRMLGVGTIFSGLMSVLTGGVGGPLSLGAVRVGESLGRDVAQVPAFSLLADYYPVESRGKAFAMLGALSRVGDLVAPVVVGWLIVSFGWRSTFVVLGLPVVAAGILALFVLREPVRGYMERRALGRAEQDAAVESEPKSFGESWRTIWAVRTMRRLFLANVWLFAGATMYLITLPFFLAQRYGLDALDRGLVTVPASAVAIVGGFLGGGLVDTFIRRNPGRVLSILAGFTVVAVAGLTGIAFGPPLWLMVVLNCVFGFGFAMIGPAASVLFAQVIPASVRTMGLQMVQLSAVPGVVLFLPLSGQIAERYGFTPALLFSVPFMLLGAVITLTAGSFFDLDMRNAQASAAAEEEWEQARAGGTGKLLVCRGVEVDYEGVRVLFGVDFDVEDGETIALLGTNGAGKSTLLRAISGTQEASAGAIVFDGRDITHMPPHEIARRGIVHMPGGRGVFGGLTVRENLALGTWGSDGDVSEQLAEVLAMFGALRERVDEPAAALSGGEQQMLSLALAFLQRPRLLLIDELSLGLSPAVVGELLEVVEELNRRGTTIVVVEQSVNLALTIARRAVFLEKGEVRFDGPVAELLSRPDVMRAVHVRGAASLGGGRAAPAARRPAPESGEPAILALENVSKRFGGIVAVDGVSLDVAAGRVLGLIGPNGAGKTTLFDIAGGYVEADGGKVLLEGIDVTRASPEERARRGLVRRFQDARQFGALTVHETVLVALEDQLEVRSALLSAARPPQVRRSERRASRRADQLIDLLGLGAYRDKFVRELSTGVRRLVDLACVLAARPKVLLLDEPSAGVAQAEAEGFVPLLRRVARETGSGMLVVEHDVSLLASIADELAAVERGRLIARGLPADVLADERVIEAYLGGSEAAIMRTGAAPS